MHTVSVLHPLSFILILPLSPPGSVLTVVVRDRRGLERRRGTPRSQSAVVSLVSTEGCGAAANKPQDLQPLIIIRGQHCAVKIETEVDKAYVFN